MPNKSLFHYKTRNMKGIDFVLKPGATIEELVQVCYDVTDPKTKEREVRALLETRRCCCR